MKTKKPTTKDELITEVIRDIENDPCNYQDFANDLIREALSTRTVAELRYILYGGQ